MNFIVCKFHLNKRIYAYGWYSQAPIYSASADYPVVLRNLYLYIKNKEYSKKTLLADFNNIKSSIIKKVYNATFCKIKKPFVKLLIHTLIYPFCEFEFFYIQFPQREYLFNSYLALLKNTKCHHKKNIRRLSQNCPALRF